MPPTEVNTVLRLTPARAATASMVVRDHPSSTKRSRAAPTTARRVARAWSSRSVDRYGRRASGILTPAPFEVTLSVIKSLASVVEDGHADTHRGIGPDRAPARRRPRPPRSPGHLGGPGPRPDGRRLDPSWRHAVRARPRLPAPGADDPPGGVAGGLHQLAEPGRPARGGAEPRRISPGAGGALASIDLRASASPRGGEAARPHLAHRSRRRTRRRPRTGRRRSGRRIPRRGRPRRGRLRPSRAPWQVQRAGRRPGARRRLRPRVRRPHLPAATGSRARAPW